MTWQASSNWPFEMPPHAAAGGAFQNLGAAVDTRSREISRHRAALSTTHERIRSNLAAEAREVLRYDSGLSGPLPAGAMASVGWSRLTPGWQRLVSALAANM